MKILVIDDSKTMLRIIENAIKQLGHESVTALDGSEGYKAFKKTKFDMILTDLNMPNIDGLELVRLIRDKDKNIPIIMITTESGKSTVISALKAGVNNYIVKPFSAEMLSEKLKNIIKE